MHGGEPKQDLRVRRTRKMLMEALIELTIEKGFAALTIQDIADRAMVNRATFYRHFVDKHDLLEKYMNEVYKLTAAQELLPKDAGEDASPVGLTRMLEHVRLNADFYRVMLGNKGDPGFAEKIRGFSEMRLRGLLPKTKTKAKGPPLELCINYLSHAGVGAIAWWLNNQSYAPEQVAVWLHQLNQETAAYILGAKG